MPDFSDIRTVGGSDRVVIAIGDIHGRLDLLETLLEKINVLHTDHVTPEAIVFLGDYIDRGDDSRRVLELLAEIKGNAGDRIKCLEGNHEAMMLSFLKGTADGQLWMANGGQQTLASFGIQPVKPDSSASEVATIRSKLNEQLGDLLAFLGTLELSWRWGDFFFCHAGINPRLPLDRQEPQTLLWGHPEFCDHLRDDAICVVHGHYVTPEVQVTRSRIGVDTGAYFSGKLSALAISKRELTVIASTQ